MLSRFRLLAAFGAFVAAVSASACVSPATEVLVAIGTDLAPNEALTIRAFVGEGGSRTTFADAEAARAWGRAGDAGLAFPASFAIVPRHGGALDSAAVVTVEIDTARFALRRTARFHFAPHRTQTLRLFLSSRCAQSDTRCTRATPCTRLAFCEEHGQSCGENGECVSIDVPVVDGSDAGGFAFDAATADVPPPPDTAAPSCGDGECNGTENACTCALDGCDPRCGDGCCNGADTASNCPQDCPMNCGDGMCTGTENTCTCPQDCGAVCGDGCCNGGESICCSDCGAHQGNGQCDCGETACDTPQDCPPVAGDGCCTGGETCHSGLSDGCDPAPCQCRIDCCYGTGGAEFMTLRTACECRGRFQHCIDAGVSTLQIHYGGGLIYERIPNGSGLFCASGSSQGDNSCRCPGEC